eukprot:TRINITY_DN2148_c0_g1::TRINITY_DN2148_c0_g1_i1::g.12923::m.12923 TRINITY_DN2148_c0_g1::TRINITY_DN2148_c0_g1_i1::g.12923  ORF type:complete len:218 (+),score=44.13,sp/O65084/PSB3_PICMA/59.31/8e-91,Proteasome/PF00227.21/2.5e-43 TRINITY_DN2148_c0_g1_i1:3-656(+)
MGSLRLPHHLSRKMSILQYNGGCILAMAGKNCIAIASDRRFGVGMQTIAMDAERIFKMNDRVYIGLHGLQTDVLTLKQKFDFKLKLYKLREERDIKPESFAALVSSTLYEKRFGPYFVEPIVAGLDKNNIPYLCAMDLIGAPVKTDNFVVVGTCSESLYGMAETLWRPDLNPDELFETISQCLLASIDRDAPSGWGGVVHIITPTDVTIKNLRVRMD